MNINPISNITRKALPLAAAAAVGLGALTACSSSKKDNQKPNYVQTEIMKLDNTLDSLKANQGEGDRAFFDYYEKSKDTIEKTEFNPTKTEAAKRSFTGMFSGLGLMLFGAAGLIITQSLANKYFGKFEGLSKVAGVATIAGAILGAASIAALDESSYEAKKTFDEHRNIKLKELQAEKQQYFDTKDLEFTK